MLRGPLQFLFDFLLATQKAEAIDVFIEVVSMARGAPAQDRIAMVGRGLGAVGKLARCGGDGAGRCHAVGAGRDGCSGCDEISS